MNQLFESIFYSGNDINFFYSRALKEHLSLKEELIGPVGDDHTKWYMILRSKNPVHFSPVVGGPEKATNFKQAFKWWYEQKNRSYSLVRVDLNGEPKKPQPPALVDLNKYCKLKWEGNPVKRPFLMPKEEDINLSQF